MHISFLVLLASLVGCGEKPQPQRDLRISSIVELSHFDPQKVNDSNDYKIIQAVFEGLVVPDPETMKPLPGVAERWTVSPDGRIYEFFLRDNAVWSDGTPVLAEDFVFAVNRALSSKLSCSFVEMFFDVRNAKMFFDRKIRDFTKVGIVAINSRTLHIELQKSNPDFLTILMHPCWVPMNKAVAASVEKHDKSLPLRDALRTNIISNGAFVFAERMADSHVLLKKNETYWDADNVLLESVTFLFRNHMLSVKGFVEDDVHIAEMQTDNRSIIEHFSIDERLIISTFPECVGLAFNTSGLPFKNKNVRIALSIAIDREKLLNKIGRSPSLAAYGFIQEASGQNSRKPLFQRDVARAQKLLSEAGYGPDNEFPKIKILCNVMESEADIAAMNQIIDDWKTLLNIDCSVEFEELDVFLEKKKKAKFDIVKISCGSAYCDPIAAVCAFASSSKRNYGRWSDKGYDEIVAAASGAEDSIDRSKAIRKAELCLAEAMPAIPLFFMSDAYLVKKDVRGWFPNAMNMHPMKFVYFEVM
jgi:oligopeptide transport system substrate-binding protein